MSDEGGTRTRRVSPWVKAFVAFHVLAITVWSLPRMSDIRQSATVPGKPTDMSLHGTQYLLDWNDRNLRDSPIKYYLLSTGFWQYWDMFAPNPASVDFWCDADIVYKDGSTRHYQYPRMAELSIPAKFPLERYRKYYERVNPDTASILWKPFAYRIALLNDDLKNPPVEVRLTRHWMVVLPPDQPEVTNYNTYRFSTIKIDPAELRRLREIR